MSINEDHREGNSDCVCVYIDDTLCLGEKEAITDFKNELKKHFAIKEEGETKEYVGCKVTKTGKKSLIMYQDDLIEKIDRIFGDEVRKMQSYGMPAGTGDHIKRSDENEPTVDTLETRNINMGLNIDTKNIYIVIQIKKFYINPTNAILI